MCTNDPIVLARGRDARLAAKLVTLVHFAFRDALHLGSMDAVDLVLAGSCLSEEALRQGDEFSQRFIGDSALKESDFSPDVPQHATQERFELAGRLSGPLQLLSMGVAALLGQQLLALETIVLAQLDTHGLGAPHASCDTSGRRSERRSPSPGPSCRRSPSGTLVVATPLWPAPPESLPPTT